MRNFFLILVFGSILSSCNNKASGLYEINGAIKNIPDSTKIVLYIYPDTEIVHSSTVVLDEKFQFKGLVKRPRLAMLRIKSTRDSKMFWLEDEKIDIIGEKGDFVNSKVSGSKSQEEAELLIERKDSIFNQMKELGKLVNDNNRDSLFVIYEEMEYEVIRINKEFIIEYPNSYESLFRLDMSKEKLGSVETGKLFSLLNKAMQSTDEGKSIVKFIELNKNLKLGERYVDFEQKNTHGQSIRLSEIKGKYTLIEFWASWCGPCRATNPDLLKEYELYKDKGFVILGVSMDTNKEKWLNAVEKDGLLWENVSDLKGANNQVAMIYGVRDIPDNFLIDENGVIIARYITGNALKNKLKELFVEE